jgi:hypothetical protein
MVIGGVVLICVLLLFLAFVAPRLSRYPQQGVNKSLGAGSRNASKAPGKLGSWLSKAFNTGLKATNKSALSGRNARYKSPL